MSKTPAPPAPAAKAATPHPAAAPKAHAKSVAHGSSSAAATPASAPAPKHGHASAHPESAAVSEKAPVKSEPSVTQAIANATATTTPALPAGQVAMVPSKKPGKSASKYPSQQAQAPLPPPTSRFADRFAPPRPPTRQMNNVELDTPRQAQKFDPKLANAWKTKSGRELTEAEILAMPESEYMSDKQIEFFRVKLQSLKDDLLSNAGETTEHLREDTSIVPDPADRATIEEEHALELRTRDRERKLLKKISQSLARLDSGDYGFCDETGEPIGLGRLIARPTATLSLEAQQRRELKQKMFGD